MRGSRTDWVVRWIERGLVIVGATCLLSAGATALSAIAYQVEPTPAVIGCPAAGCAGVDDQVEITYLGVGGFLVRYRGAALLTAMAGSGDVVGTSVGVTRDS